MKTAFGVSWRDAPAALELGAGTRPTAIDGQPVYYRRKPVALAFQGFHRGTGQVLNITGERMDRWHATLNRRIAKGIIPYVYPRHLKPGEQPSARETLGYVLGAVRDGDQWHLELQLIGDDARKAAAVNKASVTIFADVLDHDGEGHEEALSYLALTPDPALPGLDTVTIAASAAGTPTEAPVFELCAGPDCPRPDKPEAMPKARGKQKRSAAYLKVTKGMSLSVGHSRAYLALSATVLSLNCGTGRGGFQSGNKCQKPGTGGGESYEELQAKYRSVTKKAKAATGTEREGLLAEANDLASRMFAAKQAGGPAMAGPVKPPGRATAPPATEDRELGSGQSAADARFLNNLAGAQLEDRLGAHDVYVSDLGSPVLSMPDTPANRAALKGAIGSLSKVTANGGRLYVSGFTTLRKIIAAARERAAVSGK